MHVVQYFVIVFVAAKVMVMVGLELGVGVPARSFLVDGQTETSEFESVDRQTKDIFFWREVPPQPGGGPRHVQRAAEWRAGLWKEFFFSSHQLLLWRRMS